MKAGAFALGLLSDPSVADTATNNNGFSLVKQPALAYHVLQLNGRHKPLDNIKVRQAIACAVDRQQVIDTAAFGDGAVTGPITSPAYQYSPTDGLPCTPGDLTAAKQLLADAGYPNGFHLKTIVETGEYATSVAEGQNLQAQLAKIGVTLDLQQLTTSPYVTAWLDADYDAAVALNGGSSDPYLMYGRYFTTDGSLTKPAGLTSQTLNDLLVKGNSTTDESVRQATYKSLQEELLKESPWVWTFRGDDYYLVSSKISGFTPRADESLINLAVTGVTGLIRGGRNCVGPALARVAGALHACSASRWWCSWSFGSFRGTPSPRRSGSSPAPSQTPSGPLSSTTTGWTSR